MSTKLKTANGAEVDPIFAAIAEHKMLVREYIRYRNNSEAGRAKAEKNTESPSKGRHCMRRRPRTPSRNTINFAAPATPSARRLCEWPGRNRRR